MTTFRLGCMTYAIRTIQNLEDMGNWDYDNGEVLLREGLPPVTRGCTLLHELIHAVSDTLGAGLTEGQTRALEQGLSQIIQANPEVFRKIIKDIIAGE